MQGRDGDGTIMKQTQTTQSQSHTYPPRTGPCVQLRYMDVDTDWRGWYDGWHLCLCPRPEPSSLPAIHPSSHPANQPSIHPSIHPPIHPSNQPGRPPTRPGKGMATFYAMDGNMPRARELCLTGGFVFVCVVWCVPPAASVQRDIGFGIGSELIQHWSEPSGGTGPGARPS